MICDFETNKVYLAEGIKHYETVAYNLIQNHVSIYGCGTICPFNLPRHSSCNTDMLRTT